MPLPQNTAPVLIAAGYDPVNDFVASGKNDVISLAWHHTDQQPTEQQINDYADDSTPLPNGQLFSEWQAENGGDPVLTEKRVARSVQDDNRALRAVVKLLVDELNVLRAIEGLPARTYAQAKTAINNLIDGE